MATILLCLALQTQVMGSISGFVLDTALRPIPDAVVSIASASRFGRTDSLGQYQLEGVPAGYVHITAWALGYGTKRTDRGVMSGRQAAANFILHPLDKGVFGVIRDIAERPLPGAIVIVRGLVGSRTTDAFGQYQFDSVPAESLHVMVRRLGYKVLRVDTTSVPGQPLRLDAVLRVDNLKLDQLAITSRLHFK